MVITRIFYIEYVFSPKIEEIVSLQKYQDEWSLDYTARQEIMNHKNDHVAPPSGLKCIGK